MKSILFSALAFIVIVFIYGCVLDSAASTKEIPAVQGLDPQKYMGTWFEIARLPHSFEKDMTGVMAKYELRNDGRITVINRGWKNGKRREIRGIARFSLDFPEGTGELEVSFFRPFYGKYRIIFLEPDYSAAIVTSGTKDYFWILARTPVISESK